MKCFELFESKQTLTEAKIISEAVQLCDLAMKIMEAAGDFEWEPQPEFRGVGGVTKDTGAGIQASKAAAQKQAGEKIQAAWRAGLMKAKNLSPEGKKQLIPKLKQMAQMAMKRGYKLDPDPTRVLGIPSTQTAGEIA